MFKIENNTINITRGDIGTIFISAQNEDGTDYVFDTGDIVRLSVMKAGNCNVVELIRDVQVMEPTTVVEMELISMNTKIGKIINKPTKYWYEVVINPDTSSQTIIGYDEDGPKLFILYPEAAFIDDGE